MSLLFLWCESFLRPISPIRLIPRSWQPQKIVENIACYSPQVTDYAPVRLDSLSVSRPGKSSGELSSVMIRNPMVGNSLEAKG